MWRRVLWIFTVGAVVGMVVIPMDPVNSGVLKLALLACVAGGWIGVVILLWRWRPIRIVGVVLPMLGGIFVGVPGGEIDGEKLRFDYVERLAGFEGTRYHWGGESKLGIDCSGLPRRALRGALLAYGFRELNGRAIRCYFEQWWFDASARALGEGYRDYTIALSSTGTIREMDYGGLVPGDLAVTASGIHILVYVGGGKWIQADPGIGAVATLDGRTGENGWFGVPVTTHRWRVLARDGGSL